MSWKVTVREGPKVSRESFEGLEDALAFARESADRVRRGGRLGTVKAFRDYTPDERVQARVELAGRGLVRRPTAGIDVMGDGTLLGFEGGVRRRPIEVDSLDHAIETLRSLLSS